MATGKQVAEVLDAILERAKALRVQGVAAFEIGNIKVSLMPDVMPTVVWTPDDAKRQTDDGDPLTDPITYGGRQVPSYPRAREDAEE